MEFIFLQTKALMCGFGFARLKNKYFTDEIYECNKRNFAFICMNCMCIK